MSIDQRPNGEQFSDSQNPRRTLQQAAPNTSSNSNIFRNNIATNSRYDTQRLNLGQVSVTPPIKYTVDKTATQFVGLHIVN